MTQIVVHEETGPRRTGKSWRAMMTAGMLVSKMPNKKFAIMSASRSSAEHAFRYFANMAFNTLGAAFVAVNSPKMSVKFGNGSEVTFVYPDKWVSMNGVDAGIIKDLE